MIKVNYDIETGKVIAFNKDITPYIEITEEERRQPLPDKYSYYAVIDGKFTIQRREPSELELQKDGEAIIKEKLAEIDRWLKANDWNVNKVFLGEWSEDDPRWLEYLEQRAIVRARHEALTSKEA